MTTRDSIAHALDLDTTPASPEYWLPNAIFKAFVFRRLLTFVRVSHTNFARISRAIDYALSAFLEPPMQSRKACNLGTDIKCAFTRTFQLNV